MKIFSFVLAAIVFVLSFYTFYLYSEYFNQEERTFLPSIKNKEIEINASSSLIQFVPNMRFKSNNISYYFDKECSEEKKEKMKEAFEIVEKETEIISFYEGENLSSEILILCSENSFEENKENKKTFIAGEGGPSKFLNLTPYPLIIQGEIKLYSKKDIKECFYPIVELHELLHVFGFEHVNNKKSVLYPYLDCEQKLDKEIIENLKKIYYEKAKAEVFISNVSASKKGKYLNFFIEIKNRGILEAENCSLEIIGEDEKIKEYFFEKLSSGHSNNLEVQNLYLKNAKIKKVVFRVKSKTEEYFYENNEVELFLFD